VAAPWSVELDEDGLSGGFGFVVVTLIGRRIGERKRIMLVMV